MLFFMTVMLFACDSGRISTIAEIQGSSSRGESLYVMHCSSCHGTDAQSGSAGEDILHDLEEEAEEVMEVILYGEDSTPAFAEVLRDEEIADIIEYMRTL